VAVRRAGSEDRPPVIGGFVAPPLPPAVEGVLPPAGGDPEVRRVLVGWIASTAFDAGVVLVDDAGTPAASVAHPLPSAYLARTGDLEEPGKGVRRGSWLHPTGLPFECALRLDRLGRATSVLLPPRPVERLILAASALSDELWDAWLAHAATTGRPACVVATPDWVGARPASRGFTVVAELPADPEDGRPGLSTWLRTAL